MSLDRIAVAALLAVSFNAFAQAAKPAEPAKKAAAPAMQLPTLPPEGKKWVEGFLGNWKSSEATITMGDKTIKGKLTMKCEKTSNGWGTLCTGKGDMGKEMPPQNVTFLYGWNIGEGEATMFEVSDAAEVHFHHGKWIDEKSAQVDHTGKTAEGKVEKDAVTFTWNSPKELVFKAEGTAEGKTTWTFNVTLKK